MGSEWKEYKLGEIVKVSGGGTPKTDVEEYWNGNIQWLTPTDVTNFNGRFVSKTSRTITEKGLNESSAKLLPPGTVLMTSRATIGYAVINKVPMATNQGFINITCGEKINNLFLLYWIKQNRKLLNDLANGTTFMELSKKVFKDIVIKLPSLPEQQKIASILSAFDDKIELNNEMNKTLEEIAQAIFKHWFIDFEFPNENGEPYKSSGGEFVDSELGPIPKGWEVKEIKDICKDNRVITGKTPSTRIKENYGDYMMFITIPDMHDKVFVVDTQKKLSRKGVNAQKNKTIPPLSICVSCIATPGLVSLTSEYSQTNQQINSIVCKDDISPYYVYFLMKSYKHHIINLGSGGTATLNLNKSEFEKIKVILPKDDVMEKFHRKVESIFDRILLNLKSNLILSSLRDTLLPKLISGEIRVM